MTTYANYSTENNSTAFMSNTRKAAEAERLVKQIVEQTFTDLDCVQWVGQNPRYYHVGDVIATDPWGDTIGFEVKDDQRCHETGNAFFESTKYDRNDEYVIGGFMEREHANYLVIHSRAAKHCWFLDMPALQKDNYYQTGRYIGNCRSMTSSAGYVHSFEALRRDGFMLMECDYIFDDWGMVMPLNVKWYE